MSSSFSKQFWLDLKSFTHEYWVEVAFFFMFVTIVLALGIYIF